MRTIYEDPTIYRPEDDEPETHKCFDCDCTCSDDEVMDGKKWFPTSTWNWIPLCPACYAEFQSIDAELELEEEKKLDEALRHDIMDDIINSIKGES